MTSYSYLGYCAFRLHGFFINLYFKELANIQIYKYKGQQLGMDTNTLDTFKMEIESMFEKSFQELSQKNNLNKVYSLLPFQNTLEPHGGCYFSVQENQPA